MPKTVKVYEYDSDFNSSVSKSIEVTDDDFVDVDTLKTLFKFKVGKWETKHGSLQTYGIRNMTTHEKVDHDAQQMKIYDLNRIQIYLTTVNRKMR